MAFNNACASFDTRISPTIWGGLGTEVRELATSPAQAGISVGVLLIGGALTVGDDSYGLCRLTFLEQRKPIADESIVVDSEGVFFFQVSPREA